MEEERWTPVIIKHFGEEFEKGIREKYEVSSHCRIRNVKTNNMSICKKEQYGFFYAGKCKNLRRHRVCLASFYPDDIPEDINKYDVDHIDGNHDNNMLNNLQWLSKSEHSKKTMKQTKEKRRSHANLQGKKIMVIKVKGNGNNTLIGKVFISCSEAANFFNVRKSSRICNTIRRDQWLLRSYKLKYIETKLLEGEIFKKLGNYELSNKGRIKMMNGKITSGSKLNNTKYKKVSIKLNGDNKLKQYLLHQLIWIAFNGPIPEGKVVMHNDTYNTLDSEGYERNWLEDLSLGSQSENMISYHNINARKVRCLDNNIIYNSTGDAARKLGLNKGSVSAVCNKKWNTAGGYKFEYV